MPGPALWKVADADTTIYLFGTVHALPQGKEWFDGRIERAFDASDEMVTEVDLQRPVGLEPRRCRRAGAARRGPVAARR